MLYSINYFLEFIALTVTYNLSIFFCEMLHDNNIYDFSSPLREHNCVIIIIIEAAIPFMCIDTSYLFRLLGDNI